MNLLAVLAVIAQLESSNGRNMKHPDPTCLGWYGIKIATLGDVNEQYGTHYRPEDMQDYEKATIAARFHIERWLKRHPGASVESVLLMWRCGASGMNRPTEKQMAYSRRGYRMYVALIEGNKDWREIR